MSISNQRGRGRARRGAACVLVPRPRRGRLWLPLQQPAGAAGRPLLQRAAGAAGRPRRLRSPPLSTRPRLCRDLASPFRAAASPPPFTFGGRRCRRGRPAAPAGCRRPAPRAPPPPLVCACSTWNIVVTATIHVCKYYNCNRLLL